jgi:hypothetical protein
MLERETRSEELDDIETTIGERLCVFRGDFVQDLDNTAAGLSLFRAMSIKNDGLYSCSA